MKKVDWIPETEAAVKIGRTRRTFRRLVKSGKLAINYTTINGKGFQYSQQDIEKILFENSTLKRTG